ncbi:hypothetical protein GCM10009557_45070 [Virgisporangium ochraceum]|uniref:Uncharacterized protein n=1 Tax=Virgisporangium ochraceum TaxID=65505 RepID=A0A8J3ZZN1_9ACTN|nr:hypothetical protein Voc01_071300 [Virgisporangium ochraceum]
MVGTYSRRPSVSRYPPLTDSTIPSMTGTRTLTPSGRSGRPSWRVSIAGSPPTERFGVNRSSSAGE